MAQRLFAFFATWECRIMMAGVLNILDVGWKAKTKLESSSVHICDVKPILDKMSIEY